MKILRRKRPARGFTLIEVLISLGMAAIVMSIGVTVVGSAGHGFAHEAATMKSQSMIDGLDGQLRASANTSLAIYTPNTCGSGNGDGTACSQVRFYGQDKNGGTHSWGWEYDGTSSVRECLSYPTGAGGADGACTNYGQTTNGIKAFSSTPTPVTSLAVSAQFGAPASQEKKVGGSTFDPNGRVIAGNRVMIVQIGDSNIQRDIHLLQGGAPFSVSVLKGSFVPPNLGASALAANVNPYVWFPTNGAAPCLGPSGTSISPCAADVTEGNYSKYEPFIPSSQWWSNGACADGTATWDGNTTPSDTGHFNLASSGVGICNASVGSKDQSVGVNIAVSGPFSPSTNAISVSSGGSVNTIPASVVVTHYKTFDPFALNYVGFSGCAGLITSPGNVGGIAGGNPNNNATVDQTVTAAVIAPGTMPQTCNLIVQDQYGESDNITATVYSALNSTGAYGTPTGPNTGTLSIQPASGGSGTGYQVDYYFNGGVHACGPVANACGVGGLAPSTTYQFQANITDSLGDVKQIVFSMTTNALPPPTPTPAPTPTPNGLTPTCSDQPAGTDLGSGYGSTGVRCLLLVSTNSITIYTPSGPGKPDNATFNVLEYHTATTINDVTNCTLSSFSPTSYPGAAPLAFVGGSSTIVAQPGVKGSCQINVSDGVQTQYIMVSVLANIGATPTPTPTPTTIPTPAPCTPDAQGYCAVRQSTTGKNTSTPGLCWIPPSGGKVGKMIPVSIVNGTITSRWFVYDAGGNLIKDTTLTVVTATYDPCTGPTTTSTWNNGEPSVVYGDTGLP